MDRVLGQEPRQEILLTGVKDLKFRFLSNAVDKNQWQDQWPPLRDTGTGDTPPRPRAVEVLIELEDWGKIPRLIEVVQ